MPILIKECLEPGTRTKMDDCAPLCMDNISNASLTVQCSYDTGSSQSLIVHVKTSFDGLQYDTVDKQTIDVKTMPGKRVQQTFEIESNARYIKVEVENNNNVKVGDIRIYATLGG